MSLANDTDVMGTVTSFGRIRDRDSVAH